MILQQGEEAGGGAVVAVKTLQLLHLPYNLHQVILYQVLVGQHALLGGEGGNGLKAHRMFR